MPVDASRLLSVAALLAAGLLGAWAAWACRRAEQRGLPGADARVWAALAAAFLLLSQVKLARGLGWLRPDEWLRTLAKHEGLYDHRRPFQIAVSAAIALVAVALLLYGAYRMRRYIERHRLVVGFAACAVGFAVIRFISLHELDSLEAAVPWTGAIVELTAAAGASAVAITRLRQLGEFTRLRRSGKSDYTKAL